ncbi:DUF4340 domain-containing protein [Carboxylicivirga sp. M1479]|uniref:DUF4340 domain-containing protein n=1 Tax=Carboxylicivirga sp. M1479 TaxID=2594476 RepID=UPI0011787AF0|nr:DUF4340 domain-containing protein [Carboxylicivirga sp. M1479]TRX70372.1 DUF4340 domain-containing protein [Carboxylicivirga sp. M1479]
MFRKLNIKTLSWVFLGLLILTVGIKVLDNRRGVNTLKTELFNIEENVITSVIVKPKMLNGKSIELKKNNEDWRVVSDGKSYNGDAVTIEQLINQLNGLKPIRLASQTKDGWDKFELTDSLSTEVQFMGAKGELAKIYIGKFSYSQPKTNPMMQQNPYMRPQGTMTSYVRYNDEKEVYAVEGFLGSSANRNVDAFRDKTLLKTNKTNINKIEFSYPADSSFTMVKNEGVWMSNGIQLDSASVANYLSGITSLKGNSFTGGNRTSFTHKTKIFSDNGEQVEVNAVIENEEAILTTTQNQGTVFKEALSSNFNKLFISKKELLK